MNIGHYPYRFVQRVDEIVATEHSFLKYKLLYTFKSPKSHQWYLIRRSELDIHPDLLDDINAKFKVLYDYFD